MGNDALKASYIVSTDLSLIDEPVHVSEKLYGLFLEDINFALDGGMYAELVKNRSFEYGEAATGENKHGWSLTDPANEAFDFSVADGSQDASYLNPNNIHYAVLRNDGASSSGICNKGFLEGMSLKAGAEYIFSGYFLAPHGYEGTIDISIRDSEGNVFASGSIEDISDEWRRYEFSLTPDRSSAEEGDTLIAIEMQTGVIWADMLSLKPRDTYKGTVVRKDIGEYLESLSPSFIRFPGGCVIEGRDLESMYSWKDSIGNGERFLINGAETVGDIAVRPQGKSIWQGNKTHPYYTTYGIGFYEFFELCEALGSIPIPVLNAGMTCQIQSPRYIVFDTDSNEFKRLLQDALDLVEFCRGGADTHWGGVRIAMGHEAPYDLKYIAIGNEQWQREYFQHYQLFVDAFEEAARTRPELYGGIELIIANGAISADTMGWDHLERNPDGITAFVDEHYYEAPNWFLTNTLRYDRYDRDRQAKVFLSEYAAQSNTLNAALAEAAYMTGLERNSDVVLMASYAPLFGNRMSNQWTPNLIWFSQSSIYGSVNYYVQKLFAGNVGATILPSDLDATQLSTETSGLAGKVGLATWETEASFDNLVVTCNETGDVLYSASFDSGDTLRDDDWVIHEGDWSIKDGELVQSYKGAVHDGNTGEAIYVGDASWTNYTLTVDAKILSGREGFLIPVCVENTSNNIFWNVGGWGNTVSCLQVVAGGAKSGQVSGTVRNITLKHNEVYQLKVEVRDTQIRCYINDALYVNYTQETPAPLYETASIAENGDIIIKLVNVSANDIDIAITLEDFDAGRYDSAGIATILSGESLGDVNSFENPENITPIEESILAGGEFTYPARAYSVNIIRIKAK